MKESIYIKDHIADFITDISDHSEYYRTYRIPKNNGRYRTINAPNQTLKEVQHYILRQIFYPYLTKYIHPASKGFLPGTSPKDAVMPHIGHKQIIELDIKDFFPSITELRVFSYLMYKIPDCIPYISTNNLAHVVCLYDRLPQGAPTSPFIANLVMRNIDKKIQTLATNDDMTYTRYADNIILSGNNIRHPKYIIKQVGKILKTDNYKMNTSKIKILTPNKRQKILGIVINEKLSVPRWIRRRLRAQLHRCGQHKINLDQMPRISGMLAYVKSVNEDQYKNLINHYYIHYISAYTGRNKKQLLKTVKNNTDLYNYTINIQKEIYG